MRRLTWTLLLVVHTFFSKVVLTWLQVKAAGRVDVLLWPTSLLCPPSNNIIYPSSLVFINNHREQELKQGLSKNQNSQQEAMSCCCGEDCRPLGFLLGLPFAFVALLLSLIGVIIWIVGLALTCICPCCLCATIIVELALSLVKAPFSIMKWFTSKIPC